MKSQWFKESNYNHAFVHKFSNRYLVASRDLLVNEIIIEQPPLAVGPISNDDNVPVCLNCYQALDMTDVFRWVMMCKKEWDVHYSISTINCQYLQNLLVHSLLFSSQHLLTISIVVFISFHFIMKIFYLQFRCLDCQFPLCSSGCISNDHSEFECQFFKSHNLVKYLQWDSHRQQLQYDYETITVLRYAKIDPWKLSEFKFLWKKLIRCLLLKFSSSDSWLKLNEMESLSKISKFSLVHLHSSSSCY